MSEENKEIWLKNKIKDKLISAGCDSSFTDFCLAKYRASDIDKALNKCVKAKAKNVGAYIRSCLSSGNKEAKENEIDIEIENEIDIDDIIMLIGKFYKGRGWLDIKMGNDTENISILKRAESDKIMIKYKNG